MRDRLTHIDNLDQFYHFSGPLVCSEQLTGIVSWGVGCGEGGFPWVNTEVAFHREWISKTMG